MSKYEIINCGLFLQSYTEYSSNNQLLCKKIIIKKLNKFDKILTKLNNKTQKPKSVKE